MSRKLAGQRIEVLSAKQEEGNENKECAENRPAKGRESATGLLRMKVEVGQGKKRGRKKGIKSNRRTRCVAEEKGKERGLRSDGGNRGAFCMYSKVPSTATRLEQNWTLQTATASPAATASPTATASTGTTCSSPSMAATGPDTRDPCTPCIHACAVTYAANKAKARKKAPGTAPPRHGLPGAVVCSAVSLEDGGPRNRTLAQPCRA